MRPRPPHRPKAVTCASCGAPQRVHDERAVVLVCVACGTRLALDEVGQRVLAPGSGRSVPFPLDVGDPFRWKGLRYEVVARLGWVEDGALDELTRDWLLYHPTRGSLWLSEYRGRYEVGWRTHVLPVEESDGRCVTGDGRTWRVVERGTRELWYVDGALPWHARTGDRVDFVEATGEKGQRYEIERTADEVEHWRSQLLTRAQVGAATAGRIAEPAAPALPTLHWGAAAVAIAAGATMANLLLLGVALSKGTLVHEETLQAGEVSGEVLTRPFELTGGTFTSVDWSVAGLENAWLSIEAAVVRDEDTVLHAFDTDLQYYHGVEGGEAWAEGSRSQVARFQTDEGGSHRLLVRAVGNTGETETATTSPWPVRVEVRDDTLDPWPAVVASVATGFVALLATALIVGVVGGGIGELASAQILMLLVSLGVSGTFSAGAWAATLFGWTVEDPEHPEGLSLRAESERSGGRFFTGYARSHPDGGGLFLGK